MNKVYVVADNILSPLGRTSKEHVEQMKAGVSAIRKHTDPALSEQPFFASLLDKETLPADTGYTGHTRFEQMLVTSVSDALKKTSVDPRDPRTLLIVSSTKGNIGVLEREGPSPDIPKKSSLAESAQKLADHFQFHHQPVVVSQACISGMLGLITAWRLIRSGAFDHAVVTGADEISRFILSGFQSFQAVSPSPCRPFDAKRDGLSLGEAAATMILSIRKHEDRQIRMEGGAVSNDANHISGPSRSGRELHDAIQRTLSIAGAQSRKIDFISAHGTATLYNDEMEAKAFTLSGMQDVPVHSLKGYVGHTLGAAGLLESVITVSAMEDSILIPTAGFERPGTSQPINVIKTLEHSRLNNCLKTASGFGGCNAAILFSTEAN